jgi:hypothetical protein
VIVEAVVGGFTAIVLGSLLFARWAVDAENELDEADAEREHKLEMARITPRVVVPPVEGRRLADTVEELAAELTRIKMQGTPAPMTRGRPYKSC